MYVWLPVKNEGDIKLPKDVWCFFDSDQVDILYWSTIFKEFDGLTTFKTCYLKHVFWSQLL